MSRNGVAPTCDTEKLADNPKVLLRVTVPVLVNIVGLSVAKIITPPDTFTVFIHEGTDVVYEGIFVVTVTVLDGVPVAAIFVQFVDGDIEKCGVAAFCDTEKLRVIPPPVTVTVPVRAAATVFAGAVSLKPPVTFSMFIQDGLVIVYDTLAVTVTVLDAPLADIPVQSVVGDIVREAGPATCDTEKLAGKPKELLNETVPLRADVVVLFCAVSLNPPVIFVTVIQDGLLTVYDGILVVTVTFLIGFPVAAIPVHAVDGDIEIFGGALFCDTEKLRVIPPPLTVTVPLRTAATVFTGAVSLNPPETFARVIHVGFDTVYDTLVVTVTVLDAPFADMPVHAVDGDIVREADDCIEAFCPLLLSTCIVSVVVVFQ